MSAMTERKGGWNDQSTERYYKLIVTTLDWVLKSPDEPEKPRGGERCRSEQEIKRWQLRLTNDWCGGKIVAKDLLTEPKQRLRFADDMQRPYPKHE